MHKISICGTFSSGKTTLFNDLRQLQVFDVSLPDQAREFKENFPFVDWASPAIRDYLFLQQCFEEAKIDGVGDRVLLDSGIIECMAHNLVLLDKPIDADMIAYHKVPYSQVFLCNPHDVPIEDDGLRHTDAKLRLDLHAAIVAICADIGVRVDVVAGKRSERLAMALKLLGKFIESQ
jgi:nicotinamide riboside kinase